MFDLDHRNISERLCCNQEEVNGKKVADEIVNYNFYVGSDECATNYGEKIPIERNGTNTHKL